MNSYSAASDGSALTLPKPYLVFLGDTAEPGYAKTAFGLRDWAQEQCVGEFSSAPGAVSAGLCHMTPSEAKAAGARSLIIGVANPGGVIPLSWVPALVEALEAGLDLVSGLHARLKDVPALRETAERVGQRLVDVRIPPDDIPVGTGRKRSGKRLLTVGTDCALGKKYTALAIAQALSERGIASDFRATGQTGIMIAGGGVPMDAVIADFAAGAAEMISPDAASDHWDVIEGQGSLFHPAYAGVSLALLHGSQPDLFVVCHQPGRSAVLGLPDFPLPSIEEVIELTIALGKRTNSTIRCGGIAFNTAALSSDEASDLMQRESERLGLPVADPIRRGSAFDALIANCLSER